MVDGGHLENLKIVVWYLQMRLVDFAEIFYNDTY